jgi:hypothetical protein
VSNNRTYEIDMNLTTGKDYRSAIFLLKELTNGESPAEAAARSGLRAIGSR